LHTVARSIITFTESDEVVKARGRELFETLWGTEASTRLYVKIRKYYQDADNPSRVANRTNDQPSIDTLIVRGEQEIREWHPVDNV
jgi:hypothetical protein